MISSAPVQIVMADILRDGGSYFMLYKGTDDFNYSLTLPVELNDDGIRIGYRNPTILNQEKGTSRTLAWQEAAALARMLMPLVNSTIGEGGPDRAMECLSYLRLDGHLARCAPPSA